MDGTEAAAAATYERRIVTILFADLVGFTALSETLDPEDVAAVQDRYFAAVRDTVGRYGGVLEKFIGDAAMAAFGIPRARDDDAERAVRAGLAITNAVEQLAGPLGLEPGALAVRVGITTGEVVHATSGADRGRLTGDTVNTAARLQTSAPVGRVLVGETTALAVAEGIELEPTETIVVKGRSEPVRVAVAIGPRPVRSRDAAMGGLRAPTIGREADLDRLAAAAAETRREGTNQTWLIVAPPGVGKSRLLADLAARVRVEARGGLALSTARFRAGDGRPFGALGDLAGGIIAGRSPDEVAAALRASGMAAGRVEVVRDHALALLAPDPGSGSGAASPPARSPARIETADRDSLFDAWLEGFAALAAADGGGPMAWLLEDIHWAGSDAMAFIERAHATPGASGRFVAATARPSLLEAVPRWALADGSNGRHRLDLAVLPRATAAELIEALVGEALPSGLVDRVAEASDGNPLFVEELLRSWVSVGLLARSGDGDGGAAWRLTADAPDVPVAPTVQAIYAAQLDDLPASARRLTRQGSVAGRRVPRDFLGSIGRDRDESGDIGPAIASLVQRALFDGPADDPPLGASYAYRHALLRDAGYASLARSERAALHVRFARWVEGLLADQAGVAAEWIGEHLEAAVAETPALADEVAPGLDRTTATALAADWLERAAEAAARRAARDRAVDLWRRSLALTPSDAPLAAARRERRLGETIADGGRFDEAAERLESALERYRVCLAAEAPAGRTAARTGLAGTADALARIHLEQVRFEACWTLAEAVLDEIGPADDLPSARLRLRSAIGHAYFSDDEEDLRPSARGAIDVAEREGDRELELEARLALLGTLPDPVDVEREGRAVAALASELGRPDVRSRVGRIRAMTTLETNGDPFPLLEEATEVAMSHGLDEALGWASYARSEISLGRGLWDRSLEAGLHAIELGERHGYDRIVVRTWHVVASIAAARGDLDLLRRGAAWYGAAEAFLPHSPYGLLQSAGMHELFGRSGVEPVRDPDPALLMPSFGQDVNLPSGLEAIDEILRRWIADGRIDTVGEAVGRIARAVQRLGNPVGVAGLRLWEGRLALARGDASAAGTSARASLAEASAVHARWWCGRALRLLDRAGAASAADLAEASSIERALGLTDPAT